MRGIMSRGLSFFIGALMLSLFSTIQLMIVGYPIALKVYYVPILFGGSFGLIIGIRHNNLKQTQKVLKEKERSLSTLMDNIHGFAYRCRNDRDRTIEFVSDGVLDILGYQPSDLIQNSKVSFGQLINSEDQKQVWSKVQDAVQKQRSFRMVYRVVTAGGKEKWLWEQGTVTSSLDGDRIALEGFVSDFTDHKKVDEKIERLDLILRTISKVNQLIIREKDRTRLIRGICENFTESRGYYSAWVALFDGKGGLVTATESNLGKDFLPILERLKTTGLTDCTQKALRQSEVVLIEDPVFACKTCPLSEKYAGRGAMAIRLEQEGKIYGILCVSTPKHFIKYREEHGLLEEVAGNIAFSLHKLDLDEERKQAEESLLKRTQELGDRIKELNCLFGLSTLVEKRGILLDEILQGTADLIPLAWQYPAITCAQILLEGQEFHTENFKETIWKLEHDIMVYGKRRGVLKVCYLEERPICDEGPFLKEERSLLNAITERLGRIIEHRQAEDALQESEKRFRNLVENSPIGISIVQDNQIVYQNRQQEKLLGSLPRSYILGDIENIHPGDVEKVKQVGQAISSGEFETMDLDFRFYLEHKTDSRYMRWVQCRLIRIEYRGKEAILVNVMDITKAKELEHLLIIQDKMASLGRVAAGIAHEIRNPLSGINIYLNTLEKLYDRGEKLEKVREIFKHLQSASGKIESVIRRVMDFSKPTEPKFVMADINQSIADAIKLTSVTLRKSGIKLETALTKELPKCRMDPQLMEEVILNLITNAADAMKNMDGEKKIQIISSVEHDHITLRIIDSGLGVPLQFREMIFDPFYTTKPDSTGIGLSLCHRIITDHGGTISVHTSQWGGAEFIIEIPIKKSEA